MSKHDKKAARRLAAEAEKARRCEAAQRASPLSRSDLDAMYSHVARLVLEEGHDRSMDLTTRWLIETGKPVDVALAFLQSVGVNSDWDVLVNADPNKLFGPSPTRLARMPLDEWQLVELIRWLDERLEEEGCTHELELTRSWLTSKGLPVAETEFALIAQGGGCDCEVVLNVEPDQIYARISS